MNWKDVLVFVDGADNGFARARMAAELASAIDARLEICIPVCLPSFLTSGYFAVDLYNEVERGARDDAYRIVKDVRSQLPGLAGRLDIDTPETSLEDLPRLAGHLGQTCDVVIVGQPIAQDSTRADDAILDGALFHSGRPCLMFPRWSETRSWGKRVLIAWKDVREAARAVSDALPLLRSAQNVRVVTAGSEAQLLQSSAERLLRHLERHGVNADFRAIGRQGAAGPVILDQAAQWSADLLVMGGFGHARLQERIFGGASRTVIRESTVPVLLSH